MDIVGFNQLWVVGSANIVEGVETNHVFFPNNIRDRWLWGIKMSESIAKHLLEDINHNGLFSITIRHTECNNIVGLVIGGLSRKPRLNCFECDEMLGTDDCKIEVIEQ